MGQEGTALHRPGNGKLLNFGLRYLHGDGFMANNFDGGTLGQAFAFPAHLKSRQGGRGKTQDLNLPVAATRLRGIEAIRVRRPGSGP